MKVEISFEGKNNFALIENTDLQPRNKINKLKIHIS